MEAIRHKVHVLPGPKLDKLISDQIHDLQQAYPRIQNLGVTLWVENVQGSRKKFCAVSVQLPDSSLVVTKSGATLILAVREALRTARNRLVRIASASRVGR